MFREGQKVMCIEEIGGFGKHPQVGEIVEIIGIYNNPDDDGIFYFIKNYEIDFDNKKQAFEDDLFSVYLEIIK